MGQESSRSQATTKRLDIQGLRAIAVIAVVLHHVDGRPSGGFLGVDVFFVVSGFLITALILREVDHTGRISLVSFYRRRIKRLMPAAVVVLLVTVVAAWLLLGSERARSIGLDALAAAFFVSNWRFANNGTDYWADIGTRSPLQHFWSLGVEEQFYLVWPILLIALFAAVAWRMRRARFALFGTLLLIAVASLAWGAIHTARDPDYAYFSTLTRAWELAAGALTALAVPALTRMRQTWRAPIMWLGLAALAYAMLRTDPAAMPVPGAVVAVLATCAIVAAGTGGEPVGVWPLTNRVTTYVGDISYSLYLWHLPVTILLPIVLPVDGALAKAAAIAVSIALAAACFHIVENPARRATWFTRRFLTTRGAVPALASACLAATIAFTLGAPPPSTTGVTGAPAPETDADVRALLENALEADENPPLSPALGDAATLGLPDEDRAGCSVAVVDDPTSCNFPSPGADKNALVLGDSTAIVALPMIRAALGSDWNVRGLTMAACYQIDITRWYSDVEYGQACEEHQDQVLEAVKRADADAIFVSDLYTGTAHIDPIVDPMSTGAFIWAAKTGDLAETLVATGADVVFLQSPPRRSPDVTASRCATAVGTPADCVHLVDPEYTHVTEGERVAVENAGATYITVEEWFCVDGRCPIFAGTVPTMRDEMHVTKQYSSLLGPLLRDRLPFLDSPGS